MKTIINKSLSKKKLIHRMERFKKQLKSYDIERPEHKYNYFGGVEVGRLEGKILELENLLDILYPEWETETTK